MVRGVILEPSFCTRAAADDSDDIFTWWEVSKLVSKADRTAETVTAESKLTSCSAISSDFMLLPTVFKSSSRTTILLIHNQTSQEKDRETQNGALEMHYIAHC